MWGGIAVTPAPTPDRDTPTVRCFWSQARLPGFLGAGGVAADTSAAKMESLGDSMSGIYAP